MERETDYTRQAAEARLRQLYEDLGIYYPSNSPTEKLVMATQALLRRIEELEKQLAVKKHKK